MGNCFGLCQKRNISPNRCKRKIVLLLVGLDNAGKTTAAKSLLGEHSDGTIPTVGFSSVSLVHRGYSVVIYDLGGGPQIRDIWYRYFMDVHGVIFVVDASDVSRLDEGRKVLETILAHHNLAGKPVLLLANKQDCEGALDELDIVERLNVEAVVNQQRCPTMVETCSAVQKRPGRRRRKVDKGIHNGYRWLLNLIIRDYNQLNERVEKEQAEQRLLLEVERKARQERARLSRAERGDADAAVPSRDEETTIILGDPFKPIADVVNGVGRPRESSVPGTVDTGSSSGNTAPPVNYVQIDNAETETEASMEAARPGSATSITQAVREQLELDLVKPKRRQLLRRLNRANRTAPAPVGVDGAEVLSLSLSLEGAKAPLPPLQTRRHGRGPLSAPANMSRLTQDAVWGLTKSLDVDVVPVQPVSNEKTDSDVKLNSEQDDAVT